jgi:hypothetical protein
VALSAADPPDNLNKPDCEHRHPQVPVWKEPHDFS